MLNLFPHPPNFSCKDQFSKFGNIEFFESEICENHIFRSFSLWDLSPDYLEKSAFQNDISVATII